MTAKRFWISMAIAFVAPGVILYGGLFIIGEWKWLRDKFTDHLWDGLIEEDQRRLAERGVTWSTESS